MKVPRAGLLLIRRPETEATLPGGRIVLMENTLTHLTQGQAICLAVGPPAHDEDDEEIPIDPRVVPGAWIVTRFRNWTPTDQPDEFLIRQADVVAVFRE